MRTKIIATVMISALSSGSAFAAKEIGPAVAGPMSKLQGAQVNCGQNPNAYKPTAQGGEGKNPGDCNKCQSAVQDWTERMKQSSTNATTNDSAMAAKGMAGMNKSLGGMQQKQESNMSTASDVQKTGNETQAQRAANAGNLSKQFGTCAQEIEKNCQGDIDEQSKQKSKEAKQACEEGAKSAQAVAGDKAGSGMDMGQMGQMAQQLAQGLGSMMKGKEGGGDKNGATSDPYQSSLSDPYSSTNTTSATEVTPNASNIATPDSSKSLARATNGALFDGVNAASNSSPIGAIGANGAATDGVHANAGSNTPGGNGMEHYGPDTAYTTGTNGGSGGGGSPSMAGGMGGSFGGGGSGDTSGASQFDPNAKNAAGGAGAGASGDGNYEISQGGGGRSFIGLKSKSAELGDLDGALGGEGGSGGLDLASLSEEEGRDLASEGGEMAADIHADDGSSLFNVIRTKLVEIKKRGNI